MLSLTHENTHAGTDSLINAFEADDFATADGLVTEPILQAIAAATDGSTAFFIDGETLRLVLEGAMAIGTRLELGLEVPFLLHTAGRFDGIIDSYHDALNLPDGGRSGFARYKFVGGYVGDGESVFVEGTPGGTGLGDIVLFGRVALVRGVGRWPAIAGSLSVKFPTGDPERLEGSGRADYGAGLQLSKRLRRSTFHLGYGYTSIGDWSLAPKLPLEDIRSLLGAYAFSWTPRVVFIAQFLRTNGPFPFRSGSDLGRTADELTLGFRHTLGRDTQLEWAIIENLSSEFSSPDIGLFLGLTFQTGPPAAGS